MTRYLTVEQALRIARAAVGGPIEVRDVGLLESALHRPRASVLGQEAYPDLFTKASALLHSLARNHPLVDGNKRLAWLATYVLLAKNGTDTSSSARNFEAGRPGGRPASSLSDGFRPAGLSR